MKLRALIPLCFGTIVLADAPVAFASGNYQARPPKPPEHSDNHAYELGKNLVIRKASPKGSAINTSEQRSRLQGLEERLSKSARASANLQDLAGKLSPEEESAVIQYIEQRYRLKAR